MKLYTGWQKGDPALPGPSAAKVLQPPGTSYHHLGHMRLSSENWWVVAKKVLLFLDTNNNKSCGDEKIVYYLISKLTNFLLMHSCQPSSVTYL